MRPYLAIIKDSFRAALANRVLYVLLGLITLILVALAPFHCREVLDWKLDTDSIRDRGRLLERLAGGAGEELPGLTRIREQLPADLRERIAERAATEPDDGVEEESAGNDADLVREVIDALNSAIEGESFYRAEDWADGALGAEARGLAEPQTGSRTADQTRRLNRLLVSAALPDVIEAGSPSALEFYYAQYRFDALTTNLPHDQFAQIMLQGIPWFFDKFVMSIGLMIAIIVTANVIPEMFDPGSLNLLLSKPISRWGLLIAKFVGGCIFIAICAAYLMGGVWLWLGAAMGIWDRAILYSAPLYVLVFAIYYSVSTLVGIWYRSPIVSVVLTAVFWGVCFALGTVYSWVDTRVENSRLLRLVPAGERVLALDPPRTLFAWDGNDRQWESRLSAFDASGPDATAAEIGIGISLYLERDLTLPLFVQTVFDPATGLVWTGQLGALQPTATVVKCRVADPATMEFVTAGDYPRDTVAQFGSSRGPILVTGDGRIFGLASELRDSGDDPAALAQRISERSADQSIWEPFEMGVRIPVGQGGAGAIDLNRANDQLAIYRRGELTLFRPDDELGFYRSASVKIPLDVDLSMSCKLAYQGDTLVLGLGNGELIVIDATTLTERRRYLPETRSGLRQVALSDDGRWLAVRYANKQLWMLDTDGDSVIQRAAVGDQGSISAVAFDGPQSILVADHTTRVSRYSLVTGDQLERFDPPADWFTRLYRYALRPVYLVFPKPGEIYKLVGYLSNNRDTRYNRNVDLRSTLDTPDPWAPLWSGLGFIALMLGLACLSFQTSDY